jgi:dUTP pyrophosphatase
MMLKVCRLREGARLPTRAHKMDAGADLYYCPDSGSGARLRIIQEEGLVIEPRQSVLIPTGLKVEVPYGHMLEIKNKSGIAFKRQLVVGACVVDPGYAGELYVNLHNLGFCPQYLQAGDKIAQAVLIPISHCDVEEVPEEEFLNSQTARGSGGFGSTGDR